MKLTAVKKARFLLALFSLVFLSVAEPRNPAEAQEKKNVRVIFVSHTWTSSLPFRIAIARGYFKNQGLTVEPIFIRGGPTAIAALIAGEADFASIGGAQSAIRGRARGLDISIIGSISNRVNYVIVGNKSTRTVEDLKGKVIGVTGAGAFSDFAIRVYLKNRNIDPDRDVILRGIGTTPVRAAALENGLIAAAPFSPEDAVLLLSKGYPLIVNLNDTLSIPQAVIATRGEILQKYPETTKRFLKAHIMGMQLARNNKKEAIKAGFETGLKGDPEMVSRAYDLYSRGLTTDLSVASEGIKVMLDEDVRAGLIDRSLTVDKVIDERILKLAQQELRKEGKLSH
ncbi:MAG: ABC transporter substrate-binding protein [Deltaproteobacteria bacterium]|nr:ABC transporter substrate-binding protein [Deltaproteobacteria bacterium]